MKWKLLFIYHDLRDWQKERHCWFYSTTTHRRDAWWDLQGCMSYDTYDSDPDDDLDCRLLFRALSLSPCVRPFLSSSSLYYIKQKQKCHSEIMQQTRNLQTRQECHFETHHFHFFFLGCSVLVAPVNGYVINSGQDSGYGHFTILSFIKHFLPENISLCPQTVLLSVIHN